MKEAERKLYEKGYYLSNQFDGFGTVSNEYELADMKKKKKARLVAIEDGYHNLAKPEEEKGQFKTRASIGLETEERYGILLTGEYVAGEHNQEEYKAGISLKAVF